MKSQSSISRAIGFVGRISESVTVKIALVYATLFSRVRTNTMFDKSQTIIGYGPYFDFHWFRKSLGFGIVRYSFPVNNPGDYMFLGCKGLRIRLRPRDWLAFGSKTHGPIRDYELGPLLLERFY